MSASREKNTRKDPSDIDWSNPKTAQAAKERKAAHRSNIMYATIGIAFVVVAITAIIWRSGIFQKQTEAAVINDQPYTVAEVSYYFQNTYQTFVNQNSAYLSYFGLDPQKPLRDQPYGADGKTWFDYFSDQALEQMKTIQALNDAAAADGFTWTDEMDAQLKANTKDLDTYASTVGYTGEQYLRAIYGTTMSQKIYDEQTKRSMLAQAYAKSYEDSLTYTGDQLLTTYKADPKAYDVADYESIRISATPAATTDADGKEVEVTDEMKADALRTAQETADSLYASFKSGTSLSALAEGKDDLQYTNSEAAGYYDTVLVNWVFDDARSAGDSAVLADKEGGYYYLVSFHDRYRQDYNTVNVRHILIAPATGTLKEGDEGYEAELETLKADAKTKADDILAKWTAGDATEDSFAKLAMENSADGNAAQGGLYTQVAKDTMVPTFNDWIYDAARKTGDTGIVETDYGFHVMYFSGTDLPFWETQVTANLKSADFDTWYTAKTADYTATASEGMQELG
ncbi:MAG: peptidylprolyl isomerase [Oscillibacter sp.]